MFGVKQIVVEARSMRYTGDIQTVLYGRPTDAGRLRINHRRKLQHDYGRV